MTLVMIYFLEIKFSSETVIFGGILGSLYAVLQFFFAPIWGGLSTGWSKADFIVYTDWNSDGYFLWIMAGDFWLLLFSRVIGGMAGGNISVATAAIADVTTREKRSKGMAFVGIAFGLGFVLGPAIGGIAFNGIGHLPSLFFRYASFFCSGHNKFYFGFGKLALVKLRV